MENGHISPVAVEDQIPQHDISSSADIPASMEDQIPQHDISSSADIPASMEDQISEHIGSADISASMEDQIPEHIGSADIPASMVDQTPQGISSAVIAASSDVRQNDTISTGDRKLFVGGMHQETGEQELRDHFGKYGEIDHIKVKIDPATGRSRGFAFILFKSCEALSKVEAAGDHVINGKKVDPQKAKTRPGRIFVGGLSSDLTDEDIKTHFAQFGTILEAHMPFDKIKKQRKGFCFIVFESEKVVRNLLKDPKQNIKGKDVDVKRAESKPDGSMHWGLDGMRGARGGKWGYGMPFPSRGNFCGYGQANQMGGSMRGRRGRGGVRGDRGGIGGGGGYGLQVFNQGFGNYEQAYDYNESAAFRGGFGQRYQPY